MVNWMFLCRLLRCTRKVVRLSFPCGQIAKMSSTYLYQQVGLWVAWSGSPVSVGLSMLDRAAGPLTYALRSMRDI